MAFTLRVATPDDADDIVRLINALADYENLSHVSNPDPETVRAHLAADARPRCEAILALDDASGEAVGFALYFANYSTFLTRWGIYLEDLFVDPSYRGQGIGFALLQRLAQIAVERDCQRLDWAVLDWNELAITFYEKIGARMQRDWIPVRLEGEALRALASAGPP